MPPLPAPQEQAYAENLKRHVVEEHLLSADTVRLTVKLPRTFDTMQDTTPREQLTTYLTRLFSTTDFSIDPEQEPKAIKRAVDPLVVANPSFVKDQALDVTLHGAAFDKYMTLMAKLQPSTTAPAR